MLLGIDHLVIAVRDPDSAAAGLEDDTRIAFTGGGRHESMGTFNRLAFLGDTYLELMGVFDRALVLSNPLFAIGRAALAVLDADGEGLATYAMASDDIEGDVGRLRATGSSIGLPVAGSRRRPDGEVVRWMAAFPVLGPDAAPFLIEHELVGEEWGEAARAARASFRHPAGGSLRLTGLSLAVDDPGRVAAQYRETVGIVFDESRREPVGGGPAIKIGSATVGGQVIELTATAAMSDPTPVVRLAADARASALDLVRFGMRWQHHPAERPARPR